jgi:hypothetical protein
MQRLNLRKSAWMNMRLVNSGTSKSMVDLRGVKPIFERSLIREQIDTIRERHHCEMKIQTEIFRLYVGCQFIVLNNN